MERPVNRFPVADFDLRPNAVSLEMPRRHPNRVTTGVN
jgi:hypothetical protein